MLIKLLLNYYYLATALALSSFGEWSASMFKFPATLYLLIKLLLLYSSSSKIAPHNTIRTLEPEPEPVSMSIRTDNSIVAFQIERAVLFVGSKMSLPVKP